MFKLYQASHDEVEYKGETYALNLSFDVVLQASELFSDNELDLEIRLWLVLSLYLGEDVADQLPVEAMAELLVLIHEQVLTSEKAEAVPLDRHGNPIDFSIVKKGAKHGEKKAPFSFTHDSEYIYSSFLSAYGMDLHKEIGKLHWKKFLFLLRDLPENTVFKQVVNIRTTKLSGIKDDEERERMRSLKRLYEIPERKEEN